jgi:Asp-tRNA(Asn)/Glu-tRNA(Gln) amidotransferase A subunit family amidase
MVRVMLKTRSVKKIILVSGPLHGIPYGLKDIIAVPGYKTTWGSRTFKNQVLDTEAYVYKRLF